MAATPINAIVSRCLAPLRRRALAGALFVLLALPGTAWPYSLGELIRLPFEQLLQLEVTKARRGS